VLLGNEELYLCHEDHNTRKAEKQQSKQADKAVMKFYSAKNVAF
jgi:hypothetical protein